MRKELNSAMFEASINLNNKSIGDGEQWSKVKHEKVERRNKKSGKTIN